MESKINFLGIAAALGILLIVLYIFGGQPFQEDEAVEFKEIPRFENYAALASAFEEARQMEKSYGIMDAVTGLGLPMTTRELSGSGDSVEFSTTNIQVEGVDEADIVKSDGRHIYNFSNNLLVITDAYPIESAKIVSKTELDGIRPIEMFVSGDKLLLFGNEYTRLDNGPGIESQGMATDIEHSYYSYNGVVAQLYDISDRAKPALEKTVSFEGQYLTSRLIGENAYFVVTSWPKYYPLMETGEKGDENIIPLMAEDGVQKRIASVTEIGYIAPMPAYGFITLVSLNLGSRKLQKETIVGNAQSVFASQNNIYLASTFWMPISDVPVIKETGRILVGDVEKTVVNKFGLVDGKVGFVGQGSVPGHVLNQFSMDEFEGNFRIATTLGWNGSNNLYILGKDMELVGSLEDLAPGESIYSARFMGKKAYLVTFKKVDPLFVIDVSDASNPRVLGKLKIPGYSDYLHPIDETHIIGVGKDTVEAAKGDFAWYQGLKMAVFDVSDVSNPIEMHKIVVGDRGTDSYALRDHKAFLYDRGKELLVLPVMLAEIQEKETAPTGEERIMPVNWPDYGEPVFQGAFVYRLTLENGFEERARITHLSEEDELKRGYYFGDDYSVKRSLYIGNVLYTLSEKMLKANDLGTMDALNEINFSAS